MYSLLLALTLLTPIQGEPIAQEKLDDPAPLVPLWEQSRGVPPIRWAGDRLVEAQQEARDRRVAILLWILRDGEPASEAWASNRILDQNYLKVLEEESVPAIVWLPALDGTRHQEERIRDSEEAKPRWRCPVLRNCRCEEHTGSEMLLQGVELPELLPAALFFSGDGELLGQLDKEIPFQDTESLLEALIEKRAPSRATRLNLEFFEIHLERASKHYENGEYARGSAELVAAKRYFEKLGPRMKTRWDETCRPYLGYGTRLLNRAKQIGRVDRSRRINLLRIIAKELAGLPPGQTAALLLKRDLTPRKQ
ncbi:MAG TPA: hypothetical protein EYO84_00165 [Planctomycetes bacterium]|nr:hypothetical protein [Planctomycetota bacterium]